MPKLPIMAIGPAEGGGFLASAMPQRQSDHFRTVEPPAEYRQLAQSTLDALWAKCQTYDPILPDGYLHLVFVEPVGDPAGPKIGYQGFYTSDNRLFIVTSWTPLEDLARIVRHEAGHAIYFLAYGSDGCAPHEYGPAERFAESIGGPDPHPDALLGYGALGALFAATFGPRESRAFLEPPVEPATLSAGRKGKLRKVRGLLAKAESTDSAPEAAALVSKARELVDGIDQGAITVENPGSTVIIDGTSNMFKICATGGLSSATGPNNNYVDLTVDIATGLTSAPAHQGYCGFAFGQLPFINLNSLDLGLVECQIQLHTQVVSTNQTRVTARMTSAWDYSTEGWSVHYFIFKEASI